MFRLEARPESSRLMSVLSPVFAVFVTALVGVGLFSFLGKDPLDGLRVFFVEPIKNAYGLSELAVKATPLVLVALGLAVCFRSNVWNIGAEGQFVLGAVFGGGVAMHATQTTSSLVVVLILLAGMAGGMLLGGRRRAPARPPPHERDPRQPDARLRGRDVPRLPRLWSVEGPARLQLSPDDHLRGSDADPQALHRVPHGHRAR